MVHDVPAALTGHHRGAEQEGEEEQQAEQHVHGQQQRAAAPEPRAEAVQRAQPVLRAVAQAALGQGVVGWEHKNTLAMSRQNGSNFQIQFVSRQRLAGIFQIYCGISLTAATTYSKPFQNPAVDSLQGQDDVLDGVGPGLPVGQVLPVQLGQEVPADLGQGGGGD